MKTPLVLITPHRAEKPWQFINKTIKKHCTASLLLPFCLRVTSASSLDLESTSSALHPPHQTAHCVNSSADLTSASRSIVRITMGKDHTLSAKTTTAATETEALFTPQR
eukprot:3042313-Amphidinium_carterae.1